MKTKWTHAMVISECKKVADELGHFPSVSELKLMGRNDLSCQITKSGGFLKVAAEVGAKRVQSDSDTGWKGELAVCEKINNMGIFCERPEGFRRPYDLLACDRIRVDVKSARYSEYGPCKGWFYRIGKYVQSDIVILHQLDTGVDYLFYWWEVTASNMTISRDGGKYANCKSKYEKITNLLNSIKSI